MADTRRSLATLQALLADNIVGDISAQDARDVLVSTDQENVIQTAAMASEPSSNLLAGDLFLPSDGLYVERYSGSAWVPWGPIFSMTKPVDGDFAWVNQGGASVDTTNGGIFLRGPVNSGVSIRSRVKTAPSTPYVITAAVLPHVISLNFHSCGLLFRDSASSKLHLWGLNAGTSTLGLNSLKYTNDTTFSATYVAPSFLVPGMVWLRIADNGTSRICSYSLDGQHWITVHTIGRTDFLTANQVGFFVNDQTNTYEVGMTLLSWKET